MNISIKQLFLLTFSVFFLLSCGQEDEKMSQEPTFSFLSQVDLSGDKSDIWGYTSGEKEYMIVASKTSETESGKVSIVEVTDPSNPVISSAFEFSGVDVKVWGHYLYVAQGNNTDSEAKSLILDISNPEMPVKVGEFPGFHNIFIDEAGYLYVTGYYENSTMLNSSYLPVSIYDLNGDPANPELIWSAHTEQTETHRVAHDELPNAGVNSPAHEVVVIRNKLYAFYTSASKVEIFDVNDQKAPVFLGEYHFGSNESVHSGWVTEDDQYMYVCLEESDVTAEDIIILDISDPEAPVQVGVIHDKEHIVHNLYVVGNYAYVSFYGAGLRVYDLTDPKAPELYYEYDTKGTSEGLGAFGVYPFSETGTIGVSDWDNGLFVFKREE